MHNYELSFEIPGKVSGKGRPRFSTKGGKVRTFTPEKTRSNEAVIRHYAAEAMKDRELFEGPVLLNVTMWIPIPKSWSTKKKLAASYASGKPDIDNIAKGIADALNGIAWHDDSQIAALCISRHYGTVEKTIIRVQELAGWRVRKAA